MSPGALIFLIFSILGGLAIFILGMDMMTEGLRNAVGAKLQRLVSKTTGNRFAGLGLGIVLGTTIHSAPTIVMVLGFVNAGLMTLEQAIAPMIGACIGTTLSMQAVSFHINDYCYAAITFGLILSIAFRNSKGKDIGRTLLGFGLLFLGMNVMSDSITPHKQVLSHYLQGIHGNTLSGLLIGVLISALLTAIWQSSGATIAIIIALVNSGIFTEFYQVYPIVLGSHIGTCTTSLLSSIGTNIEARRAAMANLFFNLINVALAIVAKPLFDYIIPLTSSDLVHQTVNLHTAVMVFAAIFIIPFAYVYARAVRFILRSSTPMPEMSYLDYQLLEYPERAIVAVVSELRRVSKVCAQSLHMTAHVIFNKFDRSNVTQIKNNELVIDGVKQAIREYLTSMTKKYLSRRQIILSDCLNHCISDIERIGDHIDRLCDLSVNRPKDALDKESFDDLFTLYEKSQQLLGMLVESMNPEQDNFHEAADSILNAREEYLKCSLRVNENFTRKVVSHEVSPIGALYFNEYLSTLYRLIGHIDSIANIQKDEDFYIKRTKLNKKSKLLDKIATAAVDPTQYLEKIKF